MIVLFAAALISSAGPAQDASCPALPAQPTPPIEEQPAPIEPSGAGLWIGGERFEAGDILSANVAFDEHDGRPVIDLTLSPAGQTRFIGVQKCRIGRSIEVSIDGKAVTRPQLNDYVFGTGLRINGFADAEEAQLLAVRIRAAP